MDLQLFFAWILAITIGNIIPGPDFLYVTSMALRKKSYGFAAATGLQLGVVWNTLLAWIVTTFFYRSGDLILINLIMGVIGSLYLLYIGISILKSTLKELSIYKSINNQELGLDLNNSQRTLELERKGLTHTRVFVRGLLTNVTNPKCFMFLLLVTPQFISDQVILPPNIQFLILGITNIIVGLGIWWILTIAVHKLTQIFTSPIFRIWLEIISGILLCAIPIFILFGIIPKVIDTFGGQ